MGATTDRGGLAGVARACVVVGAMMGVQILNDAREGGDGARARARDAFGEEVREVVRGRVRGVVRGVRRVRWRRGGGVEGDGARGERGSAATFATTAVSLDGGRERRRRGRARNACSWMDVRGRRER